MGGQYSKVDPSAGPYKAAYEKRLMISLYPGHWINFTSGKGGRRRRQQRKVASRIPMICWPAVAGEPEMRGVVLLGEALVVLVVDSGILLLRSAGGQRARECFLAVPCRQIDMH